MFAVDNSLLLGVELFSFLLEDFVTDSLMLGDALGVELSAASNRTFDKSGGIILHDL